MVTVSMTSMAKVEAPEIVNAVVTAAHNKADYLARLEADGQIGPIDEHKRSLEDQRDRTRLERSNLVRKEEFPDFKARLKKRSAEVRTLAARKAEVEPELARLDAELHLLRARGAASDVVADAQARYEQLIERLVQLNERYRLADLSQRELKALVDAYTELEGREQALTEQINELDERLLELRTRYRNSPDTLDVVHAARTPQSPSLPRWDVLLGGGAGVGLILGLLAGLFAHVAAKKK